MYRLRRMRINESRCSLYFENDSVVDDHVREIHAELHALIQQRQRHLAPERNLQQDKLMCKGILINAFQKARSQNPVNLLRRPDNPIAKLFKNQHTYLMSLPLKALILFLFFVQFVQFVAAFPNDAVMVVVNEGSGESGVIGDYYAAKRDVAQICRIRTSETESVTRDAFEREILRPVADCLRKNSLQDSILYLVTTRGVPSTIENSLVSVDSELALTYRYMVTGIFPSQTRIENPYFTVSGNPRPFLRRDFDIYLVTRLTSTDLVDRALSAQAGGDFYFDLVSPQPSTESDWAQQAAALLKKAGHKATVEDSAREPQNAPALQGYASRRSLDAPNVQWQPGAIAIVLDKDAGRAAWSYVTGGVTGFGSYVADPLQDGYFRPQILFPAYTSGFNLAESYYASCRYLGWRQVVIGDPLAAPYAKAPAKAQASAIDQATGLPEIFAGRRRAWLMRKYSTSREAVELLLRAEAAESRGDRGAALDLAAKSLDRDPYLEEASKLKARLDPPAPEAAAAAPATQDAAAAQPPKPAPAQETAAAPSAGMAEPSLDFPVRLVSRTPIEYPEEARAANIQGVVVVNLLIDENGQVMKAEAVHGNRKLVKAAIESVKRWRFEPQLENGRPVVSNYTLPITFKIK